MDDLFAQIAAPLARPARSIAAHVGEAPMSTQEIIARYGVADLKSPAAHTCFRCGVSTGLSFGLPARGEKSVFACREHIGELR